MCAVRLHTHIGVHVQRHSLNRPPSTPTFLPLFLPLALCFSYITARCPRPNLHFSSFASLSLSLCLFYSLLFSPHSSPLAFQPPFVVQKWEGGKGGGPKHERRQNVNARVCVEAHMVAVLTATVSQLLFSRWCFIVLIKRCCGAEQQGVWRKCLVPKLNI